MISIAVVDDETVFSDQMTGMLHRWQAAHGVELEITCFEDGIEIAEDFRHKWDIIFLDIQMKLLNGLETARRIRACDSDVILIFVTTMAQYAINGYEVDAFDYILKPLEYAKFELRMNKAAKEAEKTIYLIYSVLKMIQYGCMNDQQFADSRLRTAKARRIKNIVLVAVLAALTAYLLITYLPVLQKAFTI